MAKLRVVHLGLGLGDAVAGRVVQVGRVWGVRDERRVGWVGGLLRKRGRFAALGAEKGSQERGGVGDGLLAGGAVTAGSGSAPYVGAANDGPLRRTREREKTVKLNMRCEQNPDALIRSRVPLCSRLQMLLF